MPLPLHIPKLIHATKCGLTQIDVNATPERHPQLMEPAGLPVYLPERIVTVQLRPEGIQGFRSQPGGSFYPFRGWVVFQTLQLSREAPGIEIHAGDRITRIYVGTPREQLVNWHIEKVEPAGDYGGGAQLLRAHLQAMQTQADLVERE